MTTFCSICTSTRGPFSSQTLDGRPITVCAACDEPAFEKRGPERGYEPTGGLLVRADATAGARRAMGDEAYERAVDIDEEHGRYQAPTDWLDAALNDINRETSRRWRTEANRSDRSSRRRR